MLYHLPVFIQTENVDPSPHMIARPFLTAMQDHVLAFCDHSLELHALPGRLPSRFLEIGDEALFTVRHTGVVLEVGCPRIPFDSLARPTLVKHKVVEGDYGLFVAL